MQVWSKIDFDTGKVIFLDATRKEDMLQVEYPNCFLLDMGWYQDRYIISVIHNFDWANPVQQYETTETNQLPKLLTEAVRLVEKESQSAGVIQSMPPFIIQQSGILFELSSCNKQGINVNIQGVGRWQWRFITGYRWRWIGLSDWR